MIYLHNFEQFNESRKTQQETYNIIGKEETDIFIQISSLDLTVDKMLLSSIAFFYEKGTPLNKMKNTFTRLSKMYDAKQIKSVQYYAVAVKINNRFFSDFNDFREYIDTVFSGVDTSKHNIAPISKGTMQLKKNIELGFEPDFKYFVKCIESNETDKVKLLMRYVDPSQNNNFAFKRAAELGLNDMMDVLSQNRNVFDKLQYLVNQDNVRFKDISKDDRKKHSFTSSLLYKIKNTQDTQELEALFLEALKSHDNFDCVKYIVENELIDPGFNNSIALVTAIMNKNEECAIYLYNLSSIDPACDDNSPIKLASYYGLTRLVKLLANDSRVDIHSENDYSLRWSETNGHQEIVDILKNS